MSDHPLAISAGRWKQSQRPFLVVGLGGAFADEGDSGAPIISEDGRLMGIITRCHEGLRCESCRDNSHDSNCRAVQISNTGPLAGQLVACHGRHYVLQNYGLWAALLIGSVSDASRIFPARE